MAQYDGMVLTNDGINLLAKCQLGQEIKFTKVLIGDGRVPEGKTFQEMTALVNTKLALGIQNLDFVEDGRVDVTAIIDNSGLEVGFFVREIGLFAKQVGGADVLYAYTNAGDLADYLPNAKVNEVADQIVVQSIITNKENVVINLNDNFVVATKADLKKHDESVNVHVNLMNAHNADDSAHEPAFTAHNKDGGAHESRFQQYIKKTGDVMSGIITHTAGEMIMNSYRDDMNLTICGGTDYGSGGHLALYGKNTSRTGHGKGAVALCAVTDEDRQDLVVTPTEAFFIEHKQSENQVYKYIVKTINGVGADSNGNVDIIPAGTMQMFAGNTIPAGWLLCDGSAVSRTDYAKLFSAIGTTWGAGDGSTTFNLPNTIGRFAEGAATSGSYHEAGLPNITGDMGNMLGIEANNSNGALFVTSSINTWYVENKTNGGTAQYAFSFNANKSSSIYGSSNTVQPNSFTVRYIIKY